MRPLLTQPSRIHLPLLIFLAAAALLPLDIQAQGLIPVRVLSLDDVGGAYFGMDVKGIGDCDGDGVPDFAVDAPGTRVNLGPPFNLLSQNTGVYVYSGLNGRLIMDTNLHPGLPPLIYPGAARRVASLGDVDGDGLSDIVVGIQQDIIIDSVVAFGQLNSGGTLLHTHNSPYNPIIPSVWGLTPSITHYPPPADPPHYYVADMELIGDVNGNGSPDYAISSAGMAADLNISAGSIPTSYPYTYQLQYIEVVDGATGLQIYKKNPDFVSLPVYGFTGINLSGNPYNGLFSFNLQILGSCWGFAPNWGASPRCQGSCRMS